MIDIDRIPVEALADALRFSEPLNFPPQWRRHSLAEWSMEPDDLVMRYIFRNFRPMRHLEFGTWTGDGVIRCVEECDAAVWTLNVLEGEAKRDGSWAYGSLQTDPNAEHVRWSERMVTNDGTWIRTDAYGSIGYKYRVAGWGRRVCQIYCDSREWDTRAYPDGFFDTVFIDGGHARAIIENDTRCARRLVRSGGLVLWHDFCPDPAVNGRCESTADVTRFVEEQLESLARDYTRLLWVEPSWLLIGVRR